MRRIYALLLPLCVLLTACGQFASGDARSTTPRARHRRAESSLTQTEALSSSGQRFGDIAVKDANGVTRVYNTTDNGTHQTPHMIVDSMPAANPHVIVDSMPSISVGSVTVDDVGQGTAAADNAPWPVKLTDGTAAIGTAARPLYTSPATSPATQPIAGTGAPGSAVGGVLSVQGVAGGVAQPMSVASLPLPSGAATDANLTALLGHGQGTMANSQSVTVASNQTPIPITASSLPLPTGAATSAKQPAFGTAGTPSADVLTCQGATSMTPFKVDGSTVTQPVSLASQPLPTGASTSAKQPALGTAGTAAADVLTVQGIAGGVAQPVSVASLPLPSTASQEHTSAGSPSSARLTDGTSFYKGTTPSDTQPISASTLPLPSGACTDSNLTTVSQPPSSSAYIAQVSITTSATRIDSGTSHALARGFWTNCASGGGDVYGFTTSGVSTSNGYKVAAGAEHFWEELNTNGIYFVSSTGTVVCTVHGK